MNLSGSIKDRVAFYIMKKAYETGTIKPGDIIAEATSGNTGIGLAAIAVAKGYKAIIVMPDTMSEERKKMMAAYGAELILTDGAEGMAGCIKKLKKSEATHPEVLLQDSL